MQASELEQAMAAGSIEDGKTLAAYLLWKLRGDRATGGRP